MVDGWEAGPTEAGPALEPWETPVWVLDEDERITYVNEAAGHLFATPRRKLQGRSFWSEVPASVEEAYREAFDQVHEKGKTAEFRLRCPLNDGWFRIQAYPLENRVSVHAHDITEEVRQRQELEMRERALRDAYEITADREASPREMIERLLARMRTTLGTDLATLSRVDREAGTYRFLAVDAEEPGRLPRGEEVDLTELPNCAEVARTEQTLVVQDVEEQAPELAEPAWGIQAYLGAPVWVGEEFFGTFCFHSRERRSGGFDEWEVTSVDLFSDWIGVELERAGGWPG